MSEELETAKKAVNIELNTNFRNLVNFIQQLPLNEQFKTFAFQNLDQGMFWTQKGIELLNLQKPEADDVARQEPVETDSCT